MREYDQNVRRNFIMMMNSPDWGSRFYDGQVKPFFSSLINTLTQTSEYPLEKLAIKEDNNTPFTAYFHNNVETNEKYFAFNRKRILSGDDIVLTGKEANRERQLQAIFQLSHTCFHEFRHYEQSYIKKEKDIKNLDPFAILFNKEAIVMRESNAFYRKNHDKFLQELDADGSALYEYKQFLSNINFKTKDTERIKRNCDSYLSKYSDEIDKYSMGSDFAMEISSRCDEIIANLPEAKRKKYFDSMPSLTLVYNLDGSKKTYNQVMAIKHRVEKIRQDELDDIVNIGGNKISFMDNLDYVYGVIINTDKKLKQQQVGDQYHSKEIRRNSHNQYENEDKGIKQQTGIKR